MTEETEAPQGLADAEPVAEPEKKDAPDTGKEQPAKTEEPAEPEPAPHPEDTDAQKLEKAIAKAQALEKRIHRQNAKIADYARAEETRRTQERQSRQHEQTDPPKDQRQPARGDDDEVERRAAQLNEQREFRRKLEQWDSSGRKEFPDFVERCNAVANMGASERPEFMQIIADMDDGHKLIAHLADNLDEAQRILNLPTNRMAIELGKMSAKGFAPKPAPKSAAPPPIKPLVGSGRAETDPEKMTMDEWMKWREKQDAN